LGLQSRITLSEIIVSFQIVYVLRDPRDVCISAYYYSIRTLKYTGDLDNFVKLFLLDTCTLISHGYNNTCSYLIIESNGYYIVFLLDVFGPYWASVLGFWEERHKNNVLLLRFEEMKQVRADVH